MWALPQRVILTAGKGIGSTPLTAFDAALLDAGIGDFNLVQVSSIVPADAQVCCLEGDAGRYLSSLIRGTLVPVVYGTMASSYIGQTVSSAIAVGLPRDRTKTGVIFEAGLIGYCEAAEESARQMAQEALRARGVREFEIKMVSSELTIAEKTGCVVSVAVLLP